MKNALLAGMHGDNGSGNSYNYVRSPLSLFDLGHRKSVGSSPRFESIKHRSSGGFLQKKSKNNFFRLRTKNFFEKSRKKTGKTKKCASLVTSTLENLEKRPFFESRIMTQPRFAALYL